MTTTKHDWSRADALTDDQIHAAALADPDAQPLTPERLVGMKRTPHAKDHPSRPWLVAGGFRAALSYPDRHVARLGTGTQRP